MVAQNAAFQCSTHLQTCHMSESGIVSRIVHQIVHDQFSFDQRNRCSTTLNMIFSVTNSNCLAQYQL